MRNFSRRQVLTSATACTTSLVIPSFAAKASSLLAPPPMGEDGLHKPSWLKDSFLDIGEDIQEAADAGKRLFMTIEVKGCGYCRKMNKVNFREPAIAEYLNEHFDHIQLNMLGSREVTDVDGEILSEKDYVRRIRMRGTPKLIFFHKPENIQGKSGLEAISFTTEGCWGRDQFHIMMQYVRNEVYETGQSYLDYLRSDLPERIVFD